MALHEHGIGLSDEGTRLGLNLASDVPRELNTGAAARVTPANQDALRVRLRGFLVNLTDPREREPEDPSETTTTPTKPHLSLLGRRFVEPTRRP